MTKKLIIGAAVMALPALALTTGSAVAQPAPADAGVAQQGDVVLNEIAAELVDAGPDVTIQGGFIELANNSGSTVQLNGWSVDTCNANGDLTNVVTFGLNDEIAAGDFLWIADPNFVDPTATEPPDKFFPVGFTLQQAAGGLLLNGITSVDAVKWGAAGSTDCASFPDAGVTPDDDHSIQPNPNPPPAWCRAIPTPGGANGPCVV